VNQITTERPAWREALKSESPLLLPSAHDALTARIIERSGFTAYQTGGFAMVGSMHAVPDIDLEHYGEKRDRVEEIITASKLPMLVDGDDGYGDAKNVTRTIQGYELIGASAIFIEDQTSPKRCGHMAGKSVIPVEAMVEKVAAAVAAKKDKDFFILARTDALQPEGVDAAIERGRRYLEAGADGVYVEGPRNEEELRIVGEEFRNVPLATSLLERGGVTPWLPPERFGELGYDMILYPASILFRVTRAIERAATDIRVGRPLDPNESVDMDQFEDVVDMAHWKDIEKRFGSGK
jgi:2-methylisocitrate lyase-like PEP mutase family enzyme